MNQRDVQLIGIGKPRGTTDYDVANNQIKVASAVIAYCGLHIQGDVVRGKGKDKKEYYFFSMPHFFFKLKTGKKVKKNYLKFPEKKENDVFQMLALSQIQEKMPEIFDSKVKIDWSSKSKKNQNG